MNKKDLGFQLPASQQTAQGLHLVSPLLWSECVCLLQIHTESLAVVFGNEAFGQYLEMRSLGGNWS